MVVARPELGEHGVGRRTGWSGGMLSRDGRQREA
jgi:hypothetical protein